MVGGQHQTGVEYGRIHPCNLVIIEYPQGQGKHLASGGLDGHLDGLPGANTAFLFFMLSMRLTIKYFGLDGFMGALQEKK